MVGWLPRGDEGGLAFRVRHFVEVGVRWQSKWTKTAAGRGKRNGAGPGDRILESPRKGPDPPSDSVARSDQLLRELSGTDQRNRVSYMSSRLVVRMRLIVDGSGPSEKDQQGNGQTSPVRSVDPRGRQDVRWQWRNKDT